MPIKEPDVYQAVWQWVQAHLNGTSMTSFVLTFLIAIFRICYVGKTHNKVKALAEAVLCGLIAVSSESVFDYLGMPSKLAVALGAIIALFGVDEMREYAKQYAKKKTGGGQ